MQYITAINYFCNMTFRAGKSSTIRPDLRPLNSPQLYLAYDKIQSAVQQQIYLSQVHNFEELKQRLRDVWRGSDHSITGSANDE